jgi:hypothetical protein
LRREWISWMVHPLDAKNGHTRAELFTVVVEEMLAKERARLDPSKGKDPIFTREDAREFIGRHGYLELGWHRNTIMHDEHGRRHIRKIHADKGSRGAVYGLYFRYPSDEIDHDDSNGQWKKLRAMVEKHAHHEFKKAEERANMKILVESLEALDKVSIGLKHAVHRAAEVVGPAAPAQTYRKYIQSLNIYTKEDVADFMSVLKDVRAKINIDKASVKNGADGAKQRSPTNEKKKKKKNRKPKKAKAKAQADGNAVPKPDATPNAKSAKNKNRNKNRKQKKAAAASASAAAAASGGGK